MDEHTNPTAQKLFGDQNHNNDVLLSMTEQQLRAAAAIFGCDPEEFLEAVYQEHKRRKIRLRRPRRPHMHNKQALVDLLKELVEFNELKQPELYKFVDELAKGADRPMFLELVAIYHKHVTTAGLARIFLREHLGQVEEAPRES